MLHSLTERRTIVTEHDLRGSQVIQVSCPRAPLRAIACSSISTTFFCERPPPRHVCPAPQVPAAVGAVMSCIAEACCSLLFDTSSTPGRSEQTWREAGFDISKEMCRDLRAEAVEMHFFPRQVATVCRLCPLPPACQLPCAPLAQASPHAHATPVSASERAGLPLSDAPSQVAWLDTLRTAFLRARCSFHGAARSRPHPRAALF